MGTIGNCVLERLLKMKNVVYFVEIPCLVPEIVTFF